MVSILLVGYRDARHLVGCLAALPAATVGVDVEVLVALNEPTPELRDALREWEPEVRVVAFDANLGFGGALNQLARLAVGDHLALLNDDALPAAGWLAALLDTLARRPDAAVAGSRLLHPDGRLQEAGSVLWSDGTTQAVGDGGPAEAWPDERPVDYCSAASWLVRRSAWDELGGFDDAYYPAYCEDVDLCLRAAAAGWQVWFQPASVVTHARWGSSSSAAHRQFLQRRNRAVLVARHAEHLAGCARPGELDRAVHLAAHRVTPGGGATRRVAAGTPPGEQPASVRPEVPAAHLERDARRREGALRADYEAELSREIERLQAVAAATDATSDSDSAPASTSADEHAHALAAITAERDELHARWSAASSELAAERARASHRLVATVTGRLARHPRVAGVVQRLARRSTRRR